MSDHGIDKNSCLLQDQRSEEEANQTGISLAEVQAATVEMDTMNAEILAATTGLSHPPVYRTYQARGVTAKYRDKSNIYGICIHTPEGYESGTLSVLSGTRAGFDYYLPLANRLYVCNNIRKYYSWHSGHPWGNPYTIGIEQGDFASRSGTFGDAHYDRLARLCAYLAAEFELRVEHVQGPKPGLMSHASLTPATRTDPGAGFLWDKLIQETRDHMRGVGPSPVQPPKPDKGPLYVRAKTALPANKAIAKGATAEEAKKEQERLMRDHGIETTIG